ncbi:hypothetical protein [Kribbella sp. CA-294648]|uniref:hypothetical protein n=1 Tax=Kribbella sp. CA-294648 TaxID=3239948 RepID=UPI003D8C8D27
MSGGLVAGLVVIALVVAFLARRDDAAAGAESSTTPLVLAEDVTAGGELTGQARTLADAMAQRGLGCGVRFLGADGGQTGCFAWSRSSQTTAEVIFQHQLDGSVIGLNIKVTGSKNPSVVLRALTDGAGPIVFPADLPKVTDSFERFGGFPEGSWGNYRVFMHRQKPSLSASKLNTTPIKVPVLHLDTAEPRLADALRADGFTCTGDNETCAGPPGTALRFSGPDTGITYLVATAASGATTRKTFDQLRAQVFGHLSGSAVGPVRDWVTLHLDGRSHSAYVAGWRVDLAVTAGKQIRLTLFNEEVWQVPE